MLSAHTRALLSLLQLPQRSMSRLGKRARTAWTRTHASSPSLAYSRTLSSQMLVSLARAMS